jgi:hypothetical protein
VEKHIRFISHENRQILLVDLTNCSATEVERIVRKVPDVVTVHPFRSVLLLSDFTGATINDEALRAMKESAVFDKPYIKKSAWIGAEHFPEAFYKELKDFSRREFPVFRTRGDALAWLISE